jgi:hypothetical protein
MVVYIPDWFIDHEVDNDWLEICKCGSMLWYLTTRFNEVVFSRKHTDLRLIYWVEIDNNEEATSFALTFLVR